jgi:hypothetical protein
MAGSGTSGDGLNGPDEANTAKDAAELAGGGAAAGAGAAGWSEARPFLPGEAGGSPPEPPGPSGGEKWRYSNRTTPGSKAAAKGVVGKVLAVVVAHGFLAGAAILVSVVAFGATGVALLNSTKDKHGTDEVATVGLGGDKSSDDHDIDASSPTTRPGSRTAAGGSKTTLPPETTVPPTTTPATTRPTRPTTTQPPATEPPPTDPVTVPPTSPSTPAPTIVRFIGTGTDMCGNNTLAVSFSWVLGGGEATSATLTSPTGAVVSVSPSKGGHSLSCRNPTPPGTWTLTVTGPGGTVTATDPVSYQG